MRGARVLLEIRVLTQLRRMTLAVEPLEVVTLALSACASDPATEHLALTAMLSLVQANDTRRLVSVPAQGGNN